MAVKFTTSRSAGKAARAAPKRFTSWSFSRWLDYRSCPARARYKHLDKLPEPGSDAMQRGTAIHEAAEQFILGKLRSLPEALRSLSAEYKALQALAKKKLVRTEEMWGFDTQWRVVPWNDWANCWLRVKTDAHYVIPKENLLGIDDHKTGKIKEEEHEWQLELYNVAGLVKEPDVKAVRARLLYTDQGQVGELTTPRKEQKALVKLWEGRVKPMFADTRFAPKPSNACRWCPYSKAKGGPCKF